jgi:hypothetical protein
MCLSVHEVLKNVARFCDSYKDVVRLSHICDSVRQTFLSSGLYFTSFMPEKKLARQCNTCMFNIRRETQFPFDMKKVLNELLIMYNEPDKTSSVQEMIAHIASDYRWEKHLYELILVGDEERLCALLSSQKLRPQAYTTAMSIARMSGTTSRRRITRTLQAFTRQAAAQ